MKEIENVVSSDGDISNNLTNKNSKILNNLTGTNSKLNINNSNLNCVAAANDSKNDDVDINDGDYGSNITCIHSNITNDGEILSLPLFSPVYRVEHADLYDNDLAITDPEVVLKEDLI